MHNFFSTAVFCFSFIKLQQLDHGVFEYLTKGALRSAVFVQFSSACTVHSAHRGYVFDSQYLLASYSRMPNPLPP